MRRGLIRHIKAFISWCHRASPICSLLSLISSTQHRLSSIQQDWVISALARGYKFNKEHFWKYKSTFPLYCLPNEEVYNTAMKNWTIAYNVLEVPNNNTMLEWLKRRVWISSFITAWFSKCRLKPAGRMHEELENGSSFSYITMFRDTKLSQRQELIKKQCKRTAGSAGQKALQFSQTPRSNKNANWTLLGMYLLYQTGWLENIYVTI